MSCTSPLIRCETHEAYRNKQGGISYKVIWADREWYDKGYGKKAVEAGTYRRVDAIPCGKCLECRQQYARDWATRMMLEYRKHKKNRCFFLTLTYNDDHIPYNTTLRTDTGELITGQSLYKKDLQNLWKRMRKKNPNLKYVACGEYGKNTNRPHYHAIVYDLKLDWSKFRRVGVNEWGDPLYESDQMNEFWRREHITEGEKWYSQIGNVRIGEVNWKSCNYVARYTVKKTTEQQHPMYHLAQGQINEYITMSRNIGMDYYKENKEKIWLSDSVPIINKRTGQPVKPPRRFMRELKKENEELANNITEKRKEQAETAELMRDKQTDLDREARRKQKENLNQSYKDWRKEL